MTPQEIQAETAKLMGQFIRQINQSLTKKQEHITIGCLNATTGHITVQTSIGDEDFARNIACPSGYPEKIIRFHTHPRGTPLYSGGDMAGNLYERVGIDCIGYPIEEDKGQIRCVQRRPHINVDEEEAFIEEATKFQQSCVQWAKLLPLLFAGAELDDKMKELAEQLRQVNEKFHQFVEDVSPIEEEDHILEFPLKREKK